MDLKSVITKVIDLPHDFHSFGNISAHKLLQNSGYFQLHNQITEQDIFEELGNHSNQIDHWMNWSDDKRTSSGWFFRFYGEIYEVGYFSMGSGITEAQTYTDKGQACAAFIKKEIESIRA